MRRLVVLGALVVAGCGGAGTPAPPPVLSGYARYAGQGATFDHPAAWTRESPAAGQIGFYGTPGEGGLPPQVALAGAPARNDLRASVKLHKDMQKIRYPSYAVTRDAPKRVPGAAAARVIDARYEMVKAGSKVLVREVNLLVLTEDGRQLDFFVRSPAGDFGAAKLDAVFDSFRLR